jgi:hypothetical protein
MDPDLAVAASEAEPRGKGAARRVGDGEAAVRQRLAVAGEHDGAMPERGRHVTAQ